MKPYPLYMITLTAAFVVLDVTGKIDWPWWQVTLPLLIVIVGTILIALVSSLPSAPENGDKR